MQKMQKKQRKNENNKMFIMAVINGSLSERAHARDAPYRSPGIS